MNIFIQLQAEIISFIFLKRLSLDTSFSFEVIMRFKFRFIKSAMSFILLIGISTAASANELSNKLSFIDIPFEKLNLLVRVNWTQGPLVLQESILHIETMSLTQHEKRENPKQMTIELKSLTKKVLAPKPEIHTSYIDAKKLMASRLFFTAGGPWQMDIKITHNSMSETQTATFDVFNQNHFPKDTMSFPYTGEKAHWRVGLLGGTGCRRQWDFVDTHDSLHINKPYDACGPYAMVSTRYHKWVDLSQYGHRVEKFQIWPIKGDAVLSLAKCKGLLEAYKLTHYPVCGDTGRVIAFCDRAGNEISKEDCEAHDALTK